MNINNRTDKKTLDLQDYNKLNSSKLNGFNNNLKNDIHTFDYKHISFKNNDSISDINNDKPKIDALINNKNDNASFNGSQNSLVDSKTVNDFKGRNLLENSDEDNDKEQNERHESKLREKKEESFYFQKKLRNSGFWGKVSY